MVLNILRFWNFSDKVEFICDESFEGKLSFLLSYFVLDKKVIVFLVK